MVRRSKGLLSKKTKRTMKKKKITVSEQVRKFSVGDKVTFTPVASTKGRAHLRYRNKHGKIIEKRGNSYVIEITDGGKKKKLVSNPIHITSSR